MAKKKQEIPIKDQHLKGILEQVQACDMLTPHAFEKLVSFCVEAENK